MSRGEDQFWPNGDDLWNVGGDWICDVCGDAYAPNVGMAEPFNDGKHICKKCLTEHIVDYFGYAHYPEITYQGGKAHVVSCFEFKPERRRVRVPIKLRREVLAVGKCNYCGAKENLQIDHIIPTSKGGANQRENLQCLCRSCNSKKSDKIKHDDLPGLLPKSANHR